MLGEVLLKKGASRRMKKNITSPRQAKRLSIAIKMLESTPIARLEQKGTVKKLNVSGRDDVYSYRVCPNIRMVFSLVGKDYVVHDILFFGKNDSIKSLITGVVKQR